MHACITGAPAQHPGLSSKVKKENMVHGGAALTKRARGFMRPMKLKSSVRTSRKASRSKIYLCNCTYVTAASVISRPVLARRPLPTLSWGLDDELFMQEDSM